MNISKEKAIELIKKIVQEEGNQVSAAKRLDISPAYLGDILKGNRPISESIAKKLGFKRVVIYAPIPEIEK